MIEIILGIGVAAIVIHVAVNIRYLASMKQTSDLVREMISKNGVAASETLADLKISMGNARLITDNIRVISEDVRQITNDVAGLETAVQELLAYMKTNMAAAAGANIAGLKAGIRSGVTALVQNIQHERSNEHEGRPEHKERQ